jgi:hypothetical protein
MAFLDLVVELTNVNLNRAYYLIWAKPGDSILI